MDRNVVSLETEKIDKYINLTVELQTLWNTRVFVVPLVVGASGSLSINISDYFRQLKLRGVSIHQLQKTVLLRTATISYSPTFVSIVVVELEYLIAVRIVLQPVYVTVKFEIIKLITIIISKWTI